MSQFIRRSQIFKLVGYIIFKSQVIEFLDHGLFVYHRPSSLATNIALTPLPAPHHHHNHSINNAKGTVHSTSNTITHTITSRSHQPVTDSPLSPNPLHHHQHRPPQVHHQHHQHLRLLSFNVQQRNWSRFLQQIAVQRSAKLVAIFNLKSNGVAHLLNGHFSLDDVAEIIGVWRIGWRYLATELLAGDDDWRQQRKMIAGMVRIGERGEGVFERERNMK